MRRLGVMLGGFVIGIFAVGVATGQVPFGGGFGGGGAGQDPVALLRNPQIRKELNVSDEQMEQLPAALSKAVKEVLAEEQYKRLRQIELQLKGVRAFTEPDVQTALKITDEQKENIDSILEDSQKEIREVLREAKGGNFQGIREKMEGVQKETREKVNSVLSADQRKAFRQLTGDEFKLETGGAFGGFGGKKRGPQKKDIQ